MKTSIAILVSILALLTLSACGKSESIVQPQAQYYWKDLGDEDHAYIETSSGKVLAVVENVGGVYFILYTHPTYNKFVTLEAAEKEVERLYP